MANSSSTPSIIIFFHGNNNIKSRVNFHMSDNKLSKTDFAGIKCEDLDGDSNTHPVQNLRRNYDETEEDTLDEDYQNLLISDTSSDWYTDSEHDEDSCINPYTHERADDSNDIMEPEQMHKDCMPSSFKDSVENESCFEEENLLQKKKAITTEKEIKQIQEITLKLPGTSNDRIQKAIKDSQNESNNTNDPLEENKTKNLPENDKESNTTLKDFINKDSFRYVKSQRKYKSKRVQNEDINISSKSTKLTKKIKLDGYDNTQYYDLKNYNTDQESESNSKNNLDCKDISIDNKGVIDNECSDEYVSGYMADSDFGQIRLNNSSDNEVFIYENKSLNTENTCLLENLSPKYSSSISKIFSSYMSVPFSGDAEQDFLELL
ncbi:hypothetical protein J437_LFUL004698 [Ladona fulva]|uniref:Uncharacterized protein n=1 Tax=Ladona fulva TaxID=123851 RepID=A0A8K0KYC1_LADFU|nr:hypothetical protein J437_LFUL004698 [Ladona fulva]